MSKGVTVDDVLVSRGRLFINYTVRDTEAESYKGQLEFASRTNFNRWVNSGATIQEGDLLKLLILHWQRADGTLGDLDFLEGKSLGIDLLNLEFIKVF